MKRTIRTEEQIIGILQEREVGAKCANLCRMSEGTCLSLEDEVFRGVGVGGQAGWPVRQTDHSPYAHDHRQRAAAA